MSTAGRGGDALGRAAMVRAGNEKVRAQGHSDYKGLLEDGLLVVVALDDDVRADAHAHVRRLANRHGCEGLCTLPEHAEDAADALTALQALGLAPSESVPRTALGFRKQSHRRRKQAPPAA